ncbi:MAG: PH domain-containing protein [Desulfitobacteriaceae bacterium]
MPSLDEIKEQIMTVNKGMLADFVSLVKYLPNILESEEEVKKILEGSINDDLILVVASGRRLIFVASTISGKDLRTAELRYSDIRFIQSHVQKTFWSGSKGSLRILDTNLKETIVDGVYKYDVEDFVQYVQSKIEEAKEE